MVNPGPSRHEDVWTTRLECQNSGEKTSRLNCIVLNGISVKFIVKGCYVNITTKNVKPRIFNGPYLIARNWCWVEINLAQLITFPVFSSYVHFIIYCRTHNVSICLYITYLACGSASLYLKTLYFFLTVLALSAAATIANIKIRYDAKIPQFTIVGTRVIYVFYSIR